MNSNTGTGSPAAPEAGGHPRTLLVIAAEASLERSLVRDARRHGAKFWTIAEVHGAGQEGVRDGQWEADRTIEMRVVCSHEVAQTLARHVLEAYGPHYSVGLYLSEVSVLRPERF